MTEFNLTSPGSLDSLLASINGTLPPLAKVSWVAYFDPSNTPFGTADPVGSGNFSDPSTLLSVGFTDSQSRTGNLSGPFALTELLSIAGPTGASVSFNSSITATSSPLPEPGTLALLGVGLLGLGMVSSTRSPISR